MMDIDTEFKKFRIEPDPLRDQFFLVSEEIARKIVGLAKIDRRDVVLEVGAGTGILTREIAASAKKVIAFEIDTKFRQFLKNLPKNVDMRFEDAWEHIQLHGKFKKRKEYNKVVSNLPYSFAEKFLHNLTFLEYDKVILVVPIKMINKIENSGVFASFFAPVIKMNLNKNSFYPVPRTNSVVIDLLKLPDPIKSKNPGLFLRQYIYQHEGQLVKNSLTEGIIKYAKLVGSKEVTKNQARKMIEESGIDKVLLNNHPASDEIYNLVGEKFKDISFDIKS